MQSSLLVVAVLALASVTIQIFLFVDGCPNRLDAHAVLAVGGIPDTPFVQLPHHGGVSSGSRRTIQARFGPGRLTNGYKGND